MPLNYTIIEGEASATCRGMPANTFDAVVTDPPAGIAFAGSKWDTDRGGRAAWVAWLAAEMAEVHRVMKPGAHAVVWAHRKTAHWTACALEDAGFSSRETIMHVFGKGMAKTRPLDRDVAKLDPEAAAAWAGWQTGMRPGWEPWYVVQKPISEPTIAANLLRWGVGGLNIDALREGPPSTSAARRDTAKKTGWDCRNTNTFANGTDPELYQAARPSEQLGRHPANLWVSHNEDCVPDGLCTDHCPVDGLGAQNPNTKLYFPGLYATKTREDEGIPNTHPTTKAVALVRRFVRLACPIGGHVLDTFCGSASIGVGALLEGCNYTGIDTDDESGSITTAMARCAAVLARNA